ncbi:hypothetical protein DHD32_01155 [Arenibacter sp. TNZ]|uniref:hypothetical protein n=1 Tax=Arenibacter TaxID=178469 RepID=UPI000CD45D75|nr:MULTISPECIES: hypothetical protein [Arenibacter]MCM4170071.1 hypothetical protein [Arenibacter sp. TNZ]
METLLIDKHVLQSLLGLQRQDIRKGICTTAEAMEILGLSSADFQKERCSKGSLVKPSHKKRGKFIYSSIIKEFERIHGTKYQDAII